MARPVTLLCLLILAARATLSQDFDVDLKPGVDECSACFQCATEGLGVADSPVPLHKIKPELFRSDEREKQKKPVCEFCKVRPQAGSKTSNGADSTTCLYSG